MDLLRLIGLCLAAIYVFCAIVTSTALLGETYQAAIYNTASYNSKGISKDLMPLREFKIALSDHE